MHFLFWRLWILRTSDAVKKTLSPNSDAKLTFVNKNFTRSHGHIYSIGNLDFDMENKDNLWKAVHYCLAKSINVDRMVTLMKEHSNIITHKYNFKYNLNDVISEYVLTIWGKYCFGDRTDIGLYKELRDKLIDTLQKTFYHRKTNYIPFIGSLFVNYGE